ncbi:MAG: PHB depolymerase family esterase [Acetobacteraceae bacterium]
MIRPARRIAGSVVLAMAVLAAVACASPAGAGEPVLRFDAGGGAYLAVPPPGWNRQSPLGVLMFLHGYRGSAAGITADDAVAPVAAGAGLLLVAPEGRDGTWSHTGSPAHLRDDLAFLHAVATDLRRRFPVDESRVIAAGFSQGASMVWELACHDAAGFTAFLTFSGGFWEPLPDTCPSGPVVLRHVHGRADAVVPLAGRMIRQRFRQGDIFAGMALWRRMDECPDRPDRVTTEQRMLCSEWTTCHSGRLELCLHPGGHEMEAQWLAEGLAWAGVDKSPHGGN